MSGRNADVIRFVERAFELLDDINYYDLMRLQRDAAQGEIKSAYYRLASRLHPDLYGKSFDEAFMVKLTAVYSRVVEAYKVLSDIKRRKLYDASLASGENRLTADAEAQARSRRERPEDNIKNASAKKFYKLAMDALRTGNRNAAVTNLKLAQSMEPGNPLLEAALAEASGPSS